MEKHTPHCALAVVKSLVEAGNARTTHVARVGATELGLTLTGMLDVVKALTPGNFYKSMTSYADHHIWQDVYHATAASGKARCT